MTKFKKGFDTMGFFDKLLAVGVASVVVCGIAKSIKESNEEKERKTIPCVYSDKLTEEDFCDIAVAAIKRIKKKITSFEVCGAVVFCTVESQTGLSKWDFRIDFNDYGEITGKYWIWSENEDSLIPKHIAQNMKKKIVDLLDSYDEGQTEPELCFSIEKNRTNTISQFMKQLLGFEK